MDLVCKSASYARCKLSAGVLLKEAIKDGERKERGKKRQDPPNTGRYSFSLYNRMAFPTRNRLCTFLNFSAIEATFPQVKNISIRFCS